MRSRARHDLLSSQPTGEPGRRRERAAVGSARGHHVERPIGASTPVDATGILGAIVEEVKARFDADRIVRP